MSAPSRPHRSLRSRLYAGFVASLFTVLVPSMLGFLCDLFMSGSAQHWVPFPLGLAGLLLGMLAAPVAGVGALVYTAVRVRCSEEKSS